jgi:hypothetical protein
MLESLFHKISLINIDSMNGASASDSVDPLRVEMGAGEPRMKGR